MFKGNSPILWYISHWNLYIDFSFNYLNIYIYFSCKSDADEIKPQTKRKQQMLQNIKKLYMKK